MDKLQTILLLVIGCLFTHMKCVSVHKIKDEENDLCKYSFAKRLLDRLGINTVSYPCILQNKRDMESLFTSVIENILWRRVKKEPETDLTIIEEREYCCSPKCDSFMEKLGKPHVSLVKCT